MSVVKDEVFEFSLKLVVSCLILKKVSEMSVLKLGLIMILQIGPSLLSFHY